MWDSPESFYWDNDGRGIGSGNGFGYVTSEDSSGDGRGHGSLYGFGDYGGTCFGDGDSDNDGSGESGAAKQIVSEYKCWY